MKSLISLIILSLILTSCGFKPIYNSKNSNFQIIEIKNSFAIENMVMSLSNKNAFKKKNKIRDGLKMSQCQNQKKYYRS